MKAIKRMTKPAKAKEVVILTMTVEEARNLSSLYRQHFTVGGVAGTWDKLYQSCPAVGEVFRKLEEAACTTK
jgi:hypothetical protein